MHIFNPSLSYDVVNTEGVCAQAELLADSREQSIKCHRTGQLDQTDFVANVALDTDLIKHFSVTPLINGYWYTLGPPPFPLTIPKPLSSVSEPMRMNSALILPPLVLRLWSKRFRGGIGGVPAVI